MAINGNLKTCALAAKTAGDIMSACQDINSYGIRR